MEYFGKEETLDFRYYVSELISQKGTKDDYLIWRDEDDSLGTTKRLRKSSTGFGFDKYESKQNERESRIGR